MLDRVCVAVWELNAEAFFARPTHQFGACALFALPKEVSCSYNAKARELMDRLGDGASGTGPDVLLPIDDAMLARASRAYLSGKASFESSVQVELLGVPAWFHVAISFPEHSDEHGRIVLAALDVSQYRREEAALQSARRSLEHASRGMSMAHLARSVTDAVSQPITCILFSGRAALTRLQATSHECAELKSDIERMMLAAGRSAEMIHQAREFADTKKSELETLAVFELVAPLIPQLERELSRHGLAILVDIARDLPSITADRVQIQQVVLNLIVNALEAHEGPEQRSHITISARMDQSAEVLICVEDNGRGVAPNIVDQIFEPMFTTKAGKAGVGLAVCRNIVEAHGGEIWLSNTGTRGSRFSFTLPADGAIEDAQTAETWSCNPAKRQLQ